MPKVPVLVLAFNRADHVEEAMKAIREYKPERLYLECDGARRHKDGEKDAVENTRQTMLNAVDWPCEVKTLFHEENLGCANAVYGAISWFLENEEYGVICEDDVIIGMDFFKLCEELLPRYVNEVDIMSISAQNHCNRKDLKNTYVYSNRFDCWGWATWKRAWERMDMSMSAVPSLTYWQLTRRYGYIESLIRLRYWKWAYDNIESLSSWATRFNLAVQVNKGKSIVPGVNLAVNIGTSGGTHYDVGEINPYPFLKIGTISWPLAYNDSFKIDKKQAFLDKLDYLRLKRIGLIKKMHRLLGL